MAVVVQLSGSVYWAALQYTSQQGVGEGVWPDRPPHPHPWAVIAGVALTSAGWYTYVAILPVLRELNHNHSQKLQESVCNSVGRWETFTEEDSGTRVGQFLWNVKQDMVRMSGSRYPVYTIIAPAKASLNFLTSKKLRLSGQG